MKSADAKAEANYLVGASEFYQDKFGPAEKALAASLAANAKWRQADETLLLLARSQRKNDKTADAKKSLDQLLKEYGGPESLELRGALRNDTAATVSAIWRGEAPMTAQLLRPLTQEDTVLYKLRQLEPKTSVQTAIKVRALAVSNDIEQTRLMLLAQPPDTLSRPFITVLVLWLCFIFASFSMSSKANPTLVAVLLICGFTAATAIYLILELGQPFDGLLQLSNRALSRALPPLP